MSNYFLILVIVYSISVDAGNITTIKTNQKSEHISEPAANDDFFAFWGRNTLDELNKVSKSSKNDENAVNKSGSSLLLPDDVLASSISKADDDDVNNINNTYETDYSNKYSLFNLFGIDDDEHKSEYDDPNYDDYNYNSNDESDESDDSNVSTDPYGDSEETDAENDDTNSNSDDYIKSESEAYNLYGDVVDDEIKSYEDDNSLPIHDVFGKLPDIDEGETNMKFDKACSRNKTSAAFTLHKIILWAVLLLHTFKQKYTT